MYVKGRATNEVAVDSGGSAQSQEGSKEKVVSGERHQDHHYPTMAVRQGKVTAPPSSTNPVVTNRRSLT